MPDATQSELEAFLERGESAPDSTGEIDIDPGPGPQPNVHVPVTEEGYVTTRPADE